MDHIQLRRNIQLETKKLFLIGTSFKSLVQSCYLRDKDITNVKPMPPKNREEQLPFSLLD